VNRDIPPFMMVVGDSTVCGLNLVGLKRAGIDAQERHQIKRAYEILYRRGLPHKNVMAELEKLDSSCVKEMQVFILSSHRGICGSKRSSLWEKLFLEYPYLVRTAIPTQGLFLAQQKKEQQLRQ
jgi:UDP-N-acetylglucosamine acyltransferase